MTSAFESAISEAMAELEKQRDELVQLQQHMDQFSATARSKRRQVSVTVDARGDITELKFHGQSYRTMAANDLAKLVIDTIREARQSAQEQMWETVGETVPGSADYADIGNGNYDWSEALTSAMTLPAPIMDLLNNPPPNLAEDADIGALFKAMSGTSGAQSEGDATAADESTERSTPRPRED